MRRADGSQPGVTGAHPGVEGRREPAPYFRGNFLPGGTFLPAAAGPRGRSSSKCRLARMGVPFEIPTAHEFRSLRRHRAIQRREKVVEDLRRLLNLYQAKVQEWEEWWKWHSYPAWREDAIEEDFYQAAEEDRKDDKKDSGKNDKRNSKDDKKDTGKDDKKDIEDGKSDRGPSMADRVDCAQQDALESASATDCTRGWTKGWSRGRDEKEHEKARAELRRGTTM